MTGGTDIQYALPLLTGLLFLTPVGVLCMFVSRMIDVYKLSVCRLLVEGLACAFQLLCVTDVMAPV